MLINIDLSALKQTRWHEYAVRFVCGGVVTLAAGLMAKHYGPTFGGLFLAFPAIFPAGATLIEKHETEKKRRAGIIDRKRGRKAAALDARGAVIGCVGLACFALLLWQLLPVWNSWLCLMLALTAWGFVSLIIWFSQRSC